MDLIRLYHTVKYLKPVQITSRIWKRLHHPRIPLRPAPPLRPRPDLAPPRWCRREPSLLGPTTFRFLNHEERLRTADDWRMLHEDKLWMYNLHYFDDLAAADAGQRAAWHHALIHRWIDECPPGTAIAWDPYPTSLRIVNWSKYLLRQAATDPEIVASLATQVRALRRNLEWHLLGNHLFANAKALLVAGCLFDGPEADEWLRTGGAIMAEQLDEQILPDGGQFELSPMYQSIMIEDLLDLIHFDAAYGGRLGAALMRQIRDCTVRMLGWLAVMTRPNGEIVQFNDAAQGIAPPPAELFRCAAGLGLVWNRLPDRPLIHLADTGYVRVQKGPFTLFLDIGPIGPDYLPGHAHADSLNFELHLDGAPVIVDSGTSVYGTGAERLRQRGTAAHNTVEVDGLSSSEVWGGFRVARRATTTVTRLENGETVVVEAQHDGFQRIAGKTLHHRRWEVSETAVTIVDTLPGRYAQATARLLLHPTSTARAVDDARSRITTGSGARLALTTDGPAHLAEASYHPEFGVALPTRRVVIPLSSGRLTTRIATMPASST